MGFLFSWSTAISDDNMIQVMLDGTMDASTRNICYSWGATLSGSTGNACSDMIIEHNHDPSGNSGDTFDIPTLGCGCHVWSTSLRWGSIDQQSSCGGVTHSATDGKTCNSGNQTIDGCIHVYVK